MTSSQRIRLNNKTISEKKIKRYKILEKPLVIYLFGLLYLILGVFVIIGYIYLVATDYSLITFGSYNAGDVLYTAKAAEWIVVYALAPSLFFGGLFTWSWNDCIDYIQQNIRRNHTLGCKRVTFIY